MLSAEPDMVAGVSVTVNSDNGEVEIGWQTPEDGGSEITGFKQVYQVIGIGDCNTTYTVSTGRGTQVLYNTKCLLYVFYLLNRKT